MKKSVLLAGLVGGVLGGAFAFALARTFPAPPTASPAAPQSEAKQYADELIAKLKAEKYDEFFASVRQAFPDLSDEQFALQVREGLIKRRAASVAAYGPSLDFEFVRESTIGPNLVRVAYLEKFPRGCVAWYIVFYNAPNGWQVLACNQMPLDAAFEVLR